MDIDFPSECPTEETVDALIEYLVGPLLPLKHTDNSKEKPSESKQKSVAKQIHAAAVLYNYYHLTHHRGSQFLKFDKFCNMAILFKPSILQYMKYMCQPDHTVLTDPENQLSLTEKTVMDACTVSETLLSASANISNVVKEWKVTKVAVLLIDSKKENCFLQFNDGVWSVIEKELYPESKKRKKVTMEYDEEGDTGFRKLAFSAVKEVTGIVNGELKVLESHVVYSLSQAKTATRFYIVQSTKAISEDNLVPIQDVISSLEGPVVKKCLGSWAITPVVEYYYLLPYAEIISKLLSREPNKLPHQENDRSADINIFQASEKLCDKENGESKKMFGNLEKKSKLDTHKSNQRIEKESGENKKISDNLQKKSKLDTYKTNQCGEKESGETKKVNVDFQKKSKFDSETVKVSDTMQKKSKLVSEIVKVSDNLQKKSKLDSEVVKVSDNLQKKSKLDSEGVKVSDNLQKKSKLDSEVVKVSDNLQKKSKLDSEIVKSNQCSSTLEPVRKVADDVITSQFTGRPVVDQKVNETENSIGNSITVSNSDIMKQEDMNGSCGTEFNNSSSGADNDLGIDKQLTCLQKGNKNNGVQTPLKVYRYERRNKKANVKDLKIKSTISQSKDERIDGEKLPCMIPHDRSLTEDSILGDFNSTVDAKRSELSDAALRSLLYKRQKLYDQQRDIEGELTLCDKKIYAIMHGGVGDCLGLKLEAVIECCNEICKQDDMQTQQLTNLNVSRNLPLLSGKSLSEAQLTLRKACQELDDICLSNNWMLPTYRTSRSDGGFVANVTVTGANFECSGVSGNQPSIHEARNSAATHVITRLQQMANGMTTASLQR